MKDYKWLQLFADGGEGGSEGGGEAATSGAEATGDASLEAELSRIPERARGAYKKAVEKNRGTATQEADKPAEDKPKHIPYADLIKSDEYKEEHKAYMDKTFKDRFKGQDEKFRQQEERLAKQNEALGVVATKYGLDVNSEDFLDSLNAKLADDDSYYEDYAEEHDISIPEAKKILTLEKQVREAEARQRQAAEQEANRKNIEEILASAEKTKAMFPNFDLEAEWQNPEFRRMVQATHNDVTAAFKALHFDEIVPRMVQSEVAKAQGAMVQSIASNSARPVESGLSNKPAAVVNANPNYAGMNSRQMLEFAKKNFVKR